MTGSWMQSSFNAGLFVLGLGLAVVLLVLLAIIAGGGRD
jgi:hypothetical protein